MKVRLLFILILLTGCGEKSQIVENLALINVISYDMSKNKEEPLQVTINFPTVNNNGEFVSELLSVSAKTSKDARRKFNYISNKQVVSGQVNVAILGSELAKKGIFQIIDGFKRDPNIGSNVHLAIAEERGDTILKFKTENGDSSANYLISMFDKLKVEDESVNYHTFQFFRDYYDDGIDPILPIIAIKENKVQINGYGLFKKDRLADSINSDESLLLFYLRDDLDEGTLSLDISEDGDENLPLPKRVMFSYKKNKNKTTVKMTDDSITLIKDLELDISLLEYTGALDLSDEKNQKKIESKIEGFLDKQSSELIKKLKKTGCDPLGIGSSVRNHLTYQEWKDLNWKEVYPSIDIKINSKVKILDFGESK